MVTDPVQRIRAYVEEQPLARNLPALLNRLAQLPPSRAAPYLTVSLDWRPEGGHPGREPAPEVKASQRRGGHQEPQPGPSWRPAWEAMERELGDFVQGYEPHSPARESLERDQERIKRFLDEDLDPTAHGVFIVACAALEVFVPVPLGLPLPSRFQTGAMPALRDLAHLAEDHPPYAILLADQHTATLTFVSQAAPISELELESTHYPRRTDQGGWSQRRYQTRADERVEAFARETADQARTALDQAGVDRLVLAAHEPMATALNDAFHDTVKERIIGTLRLDAEATIAEQIAATMPVVEEYERRREGEAVQQVADNLGPGGTAVAGAEDVVTALLGGQVLTLVVNDDFAAAGWADYDQGVAGAGESPEEHPYGGDPGTIVAVPLEEELVRRAFQAGAEVEIVHTEMPVSFAEQMEVPEAGSERPRTTAAKRLDELGGVGAVLRFALSGEQATAEL